MYRTKGYSKRAIARELDISRKTVHKIISEYESSLDCSDLEASLETLLSRAPVATTPSTKSVDTDT